MIHKLKRLSIRLLATVLVFLAFLMGIVLNPALLYANSTNLGKFTIYHNQKLDPAFQSRLSAAENLVKFSELYDADVKIDICLNDGAYYPALVTKTQGRAFASGFYNKLVVQSNINSVENYAELNGYKWDLTRLLTHEMVHIMQYHKLGLTGSNPIASYPSWKWEGYPEYISRKCPANNNLAHNIKHLLETEKTGNNGWISFNDGTGTSMAYYKAWLMVQYCMDQKKMSYTDLLKDTQPEKEIWNEMMQWYPAQHNS